MTLSQIAFARGAPNGVEIARVRTHLLICQLERESG